MRRLARRRQGLAVVVLIGALLLAPGATPGAVPVPGAASVTPAVAEAWTLLQTFHEDLGRIDRARELLEKELSRQPSLEALLLLGWVQLEWSDLRAKTVDEKLAGYERGRDVARRAIELAPDSPEAHLWYAANLGRWAITKGKLRAAFTLSTLREEIDTVLRLDPHNLAGLALAGTFYLETPGFLGGDVPRAEGYQRKALALDPHFTRARVELGRILIEQGRYADARRELRQVIDERQPTYVAGWAVRHKPLAVRLLSEIHGKS
jgi:tetratricopeptide (TPR) repeat protein